MSKVEKWNPIDPKFFEGKSLKELQQELKDAYAFAEKHPKFKYGWHNEYIQELRKRVAEHIGRKK